MVSEFQCFVSEVYFPFFTVAGVKRGHHPTQAQHHFPESLLLREESYSTSSGQNNHHSSPLSAQAILMASLLESSDAKNGVFSHHYNTPDSFREGFETRDVVEVSNDQALSKDKESSKVLPTQSQFSRHYNTPDSFREGVETGDDASDKDAVNLTPDLIARQYNTPDKFREGFESRDINVDQTRKQSLMSPDDILHNLNDNNEIPGDNSGIFLGLQNKWTVPQYEILPEEFLDQERTISHSRLSPELEQQENLYFDTDDTFSRDLTTAIMTEDDNRKHRGTSEGNAYTEGGLVYLPKQNRGKKFYDSR
jgi:hypothetical protein